MTEARLDLVGDILTAERRIGPHIRETALEYAPFLSRTTGAEIYLKLESQQISGSFKYRGVANFLLSLREKDRRRGVVCASTGNHGAALARFLATFGERGTAFLPQNTEPSKVDELREQGMDLHICGNNVTEAESEARQYARRHHRIYVPPYNDHRIIAGQGTIGPELERQAGTFDVVLAPVGGGGLISGLAAYLKARRDLSVIGCQPKHSAAMAASIEAGRLVDVDHEPTLSDGTAGGIEPGSVTFDLCRRHVDDFILVSETEIGRAMFLLLKHHRLLVEGAAALSVAALLQQKSRFFGQKLILIVSGKRIGLATLDSVLQIPRPTCA